MQFSSRPFLVSLLCFSALTAVAPSPAMAQEKAARLDVRASVQDGYVRVVLASPSGLPGYTVEKQGTGAVLVRFRQPVTLGGKDVSAANGALDVTALSAGILKITFNNIARTRDVEVGNRLLLDLFGGKVPAAAAKPPETEAEKPETPAPQAAAPQAASPETPAPQAKPEGAAKPAAAPAQKPQALPQTTELPPGETDDAARAEPPAAAPEHAPDAAAKPATSHAAPAAKPDEKSIPSPATAHETATAPSTQPAAAPAAHDVPPVAAAPVTAVETQPVTPAQAAPATAPAAATPAAAAPAPARLTTQTVFGLSSTKRLAVAVFARGDDLWVVTDQPDLAIGLQIESGDPAPFGEISTIDIAGGKAFRMNLPQNANVKVDGGGLVWEITITPGAQVAPAAAPIERMLTDPAGPSVQLGLGGATRLFKLTDPERGDDLAVVTVARAGTPVTPDRHFVDFDLLPAFAGGIIAPRADGISVAVGADMVTVRKKQGLNIGLEEKPVAEDTDKSPLSPDERKIASAPRFYAFSQWMLGKPGDYITARQSIDERSATQDLDVRVQETVTGAKFMFAHGLPQEALGYVEIALGLMPALKNSGEFQALQGAVYASSDKNAEAVQVLSSAGIALMPEARIWKAVALAQSGKTDDAYAALPRDVGALSAYPTRVLELMVPPLMDTVIAKKDSALATRLQTLLDSRHKDMLPGARAMADYYSARADLLAGKGEDGIKKLIAVADTFGGPYPVKATLDLVDYNYGGGTISRDDMIARLERFRFGWRGDELEAQVNEKLGLVYIAKGDERKGLGILRNAIQLAKTPADKTRIDAVMKKAFRDLYLGNPKTPLSPIDAASTANEFRDLIPAGAEGEKIVAAIAEKLVEVDLLEQAAGLLEQHMDKATSPLSAVQMAERAAGIRLLNKTPDKAIAAIDRAKGLASQNNVTIPAGLAMRLELLRARALADQGNTDAALAALAAMPDTPDKARLIVDTAWDGQKWDVAADAIGKLLAAEKIDPAKAPTQPQAQMILNRALAFNLAADNAGMAEMRQRYTEIMRKSPLFRSFQMVTRAAQEAALADRETLMNMVSEVGMFSSFLDAYRQINAPAPAPAAAPAQTTPAAPAQPAAPATPPEEAE